MFRWLVLLATHLSMLALGTALGIYLLPILTAPKGPDLAELRAAADAAMFKARFVRDLPGSDLLHWGEGEVRIARDRIAHEGRLAPGPDYKLYLAKEFVDTREKFLAIKRDAARIGDVKTFDGFLVAVPPGIDVTAYTTVVVWCEAFSQFISAAKYK
jgi:hypothetical protein